MLSSEKDKGELMDAYAPKACNEEVCVESGI